PPCTAIRPAPEETLPFDAKVAWYRLPETFARVTADPPSGRAKDTFDDSVTVLSVMSSVEVAGSLRSTTLTAWLEVSMRHWQSRLRVIAWARASCMYSCT